MKKSLFLVWSIGLAAILAGCSKVGGATDDNENVIDHSDNVFPVLIVNKPLNNEVLKSGDTIFVEGSVTDNKTMYRGRIRITDDANGFMMKEEFYETHVASIINFNTFFNTNVSGVTNYTVLVEFEDHGLNKVSAMIKVKVNP